MRVLITTGDPDGIGWEVTAKALQALGPRPGVQFVCYKAPSRHSNPLGRRFATLKLRTLAEASASAFDPRTAIEIHSQASPAEWVEEGARACLRGEFHALVTAPLSKTSIVKSGRQDIGHTEILARVSGARQLHMGFVGAKFCVVLATGHLPLGEAVASLSLETMTSALKAARQMRAILPGSRRGRPLALVGVNPHAGEDGLIGAEEIWFRRMTGGDVHGPLVPDAAFLPKNWSKYSVYICPYHDQGLIPFKLAHGFGGGVHLTLGLPFVRTSVDHGTAKDLFGKNKAEAGSMKDALTTAIRLAKEKFR